MEQPPVQIGQYLLGKNLGIGAFGKVRLSLESLVSALTPSD
jgi:5'-AMP-activated protein kinase catalytic alpha subunit